MLIRLNSSFIKLILLVPITSRKEESRGDSTTEDDSISSQITLFLGKSLEMGDYFTKHMSVLTEFVSLDATGIPKQLNLSLLLTFASSLHKTLEEKVTLIL